MPAACRLGDMSTGHSQGDHTWPPRANDQGSPNVYINGIPAHRVGDHWVAHTCIKVPSKNHEYAPDTHEGVLSQGSPTVFVNGQPLGRVGDAISCGDHVATGSPNVFIN